VQSRVAVLPACWWRGQGRALRQVPITYTNEMGWTTELLRLLPTIGLIGLYIWFTRRQLGGFGGGGGGMGGRGIFNVGKAQARCCFLLHADCPSSAEAVRK
jgi:ATP-dependent Zn protease